MSLLNTIQNDSNIKETGDSLGGGRTLLESGVHRAMIKIAYLTQATTGTVALNLVADINGAEYKETIYITNKDKQTSYVDKNSGEKRHLVGFLTGDAISLLTTGVSILEQPTERKIVKVWDFTQNKEVPTEVDCLVGLIGKEIQLGIQQETKFKQAKQADGSYADTAEVLSSNKISYAFHPTNNKTVAECRAKVEVAEFMEEWKKKWTGVTNDRTKGKTPSASTGTAGAPGNVTKPTSAMFV